MQFYALKKMKAQPKPPALVDRRRHSRASSKPSQPMRPKTERSTAVERTQEEAQAQQMSVERTQGSQRTRKDMKRSKATHSREKKMHQRESRKGARQTRSHLSAVQSVGTGETSSSIQMVGKTRANRSAAPNDLKKKGAVDQNAIRL